MARLLLGNIEPGTSDDEIRAFLEKFGLPSFDTLEHVEGDGSRPAVMLNFEHVDGATLTKLKPRIHQMFWKGRKLHVIVLREQDN
jgi:hypothetical protein